MGKSKYELAAPPRFMIPHEKSDRAATGTIMISFTSADCAEVLLTKRFLWVHCERCPIRRFDDRPPVHHCSTCHSTKHRDDSKKCQGPRCEHCGDTKHTSDDHPEDTALKCINCGGNHTTRDRVCPARRAQNAEKKTSNSNKSV
ncbi:hypothetical protein DL93DRAFT_2081716 [Clavulina sp. PMI_390]|nr:hypothetical protein DL93DRAFT_2081716 [Clavulina sp. PMI_390]